MHGPAVASIAAGKTVGVAPDADLYYNCLASPTGPEDYVVYSDGSWSWCVPWIAGLYALLCQVRPEITPEQFWAEALKTGETIQLHRGDTDVTFGTIANPGALIESLQRDKQR
jgi:hypothetical protein